jgi:hypothetical protein
VPSTFIQFNLSGTPLNATVSKASLRLYVDAVTSAGAFDVYELDTPWTEGALNFTNAPTPGLSATGSKPISISSVNGNQFVLVDITTLVQDWINGTVPNNGIALKLTSATGGFSFDSKESPLTSHEPALEIIGAQPGPAGPAGPQGQAGLIAKEVAKVFPELVAYNPDGSPYKVRYQFLSSMLLNEVQKQYRRAQDEAEMIHVQQRQIQALEERLSRIEKMLSAETAAGSSLSALENR